MHGVLTIGNHGSVPANHRIDTDRFAAGHAGRWAAGGSGSLPACRKGGCATRELGADNYQREESCEIHEVGWAPAGRIQPENDSNARIEFVVIEPKGCN